MSKILITGSTGNLGGATIDHLFKTVNAQEIIAFARNRQKADKLAEKGIEIREGNFDDVASLDKAMQGIDRVLLISGADNKRLQQHQNVINAAKKARVKRIVYTGVAMKDVNTSAAKDHMESHFLTEDYIKESGLDYTFMQNSLYYDVIPNFAGQNPVETGILLPAGDGKVPFALRDEMAEALAAVLTGSSHSTKTYQITGTDLYSFQDIADELSTLSGKEVKYTDADEASFPDVLKTKGLPEEAITVATGFSADIKHHQYEILSNDLANLLGRKPASLNTALKKLYNL